MIRFVIAIGILHPMNVHSSSNVERIIGSKLDVHDEGKAFMKHRSTIHLTVAVCVFEDQDTIGGRSVIIVGSKMRMTFRDEYPTTSIDRDPSRRNNIRFLGEQFHLQSLVAHGGLSAGHSSRDD